MRGITQAQSRISSLGRDQRMTATITEPKSRFWQRQRRQKPPPPLDATLLRQPLRWLKNKTLLAVDGLALVHVGTMIVVALYYLAFETIPGVKYDWDHALSDGLHIWGAHVHLALLSTAHWAQWRHLIRNVGEGLLGGYWARRSSGITSR
jgi:hypothetical protein